MEPECTIDAQASTAPDHDLVEFPVGSPDPGPSGGVQTPQTVVRVSFEGFDETELAVARLVARVRAAVAEGSTLAVMEAGIHQEMLAVGRAATQDGLNAVSAAQVRRHDVTGPEGVTRRG